MRDRDPCFCHDRHGLMEYRASTVTGSEYTARPRCCHCLKEAEEALFRGGPMLPVLERKRVTLPIWGAEWAKESVDLRSPLIGSSLTLGVH